MAEDAAKGTPTWVWIALALVVLYFVTRQVTTAAKTATSGAAKNFGYGVGAGVTDSASSALGKFFKGLFSDGTKSSDDAGGPVDISGSVDWDRNPPADAIDDEY